MGFWKRRDSKETNDGKFFGDDESFAGKKGASNRVIPKESFDFHVGRHSVDLKHGSKHHDAHQQDKFLEGEDFDERETTRRSSTALPLDKKQKQDSRLKPQILTSWQLLTEYHVINPNWKYKIRWDILMILLLLFTALVTPFEVAFLEPAFNYLFYVNRLVDLGFLGDMIVTFFLAYPVVEGQPKLVYDLTSIGARYMKVWFWVDFVSLLPVDILVLIGTDGRVRVVRLIKLLRLARTWRLVKPGGLLHTSKINYNTLNLVMFMILIVFFAHWMACAWRLLPDLENVSDNWVVSYGFDSDEYKIDMDKIMNVYVVSLYWSIMTVTTIGYGDIVPVSIAERWFCVLAMMMGGLIFGYIIGAVGNVVQQASAKENEYHKAMNDLKHFMIDNNLPPRLQMEIKQYFQHLHQGLDVNAYEYYTELISPALNSKLLLYMNKTWIARVPHFQDAPQDFIVQVASILSRHLFPPKEVILQIGTPPMEVYIVNKGIAAGNNRLFTVGQLIGSDAFVRSYTMRSYSTHAITYIQCSRLDRDELFEVLENWPEMNKKFRLLAIKTIFREEVKAYCVAKRTMKARQRERQKSSARGSGIDLDGSFHSGVRDIPDLGSSGDESKVGRQGTMGDSNDPEDSFGLQDLTEGGEGEQDKETRMKDLFNKSQRTEFYTKKLEALTRKTEEEEAQLQAAVVCIQEAVRRYKVRKQARRQSANRPAIRKPATPQIHVTGFNMDLLRDEFHSLIQKQQELMTWFQAQDESQRSVQKELKVAKRLSMRTSPSTRPSMTQLNS